jgi:hypothetical protein
LYKVDSVTHQHQAHDSFSAFSVLYHSGYIEAALKDAGQNWLKVGSESWNKYHQRQYALANKQTVTEMFAAVSSEVDNIPSANSDNDTGLNSLIGFSLNGQSKVMRQKMLDDVFILGRMALMGQSTVFYAPPSAGKTLITMKLIIENVRNCNIDGNNVFYINADDNHKGVVEKLEIAEKAGFHMLVPGHNDFETVMFEPLIKKMIEDGTATGVILILDTLKKFTNLMEKTMASEFGEVIRKFSSQGGTVISLAHVNKNKDSEGKNIHAGTTDIKDDADCVYVIDVVNDINLTKTIEFRNIKSRGNVTSKVSYEYSNIKGIEYNELLDSVKEISSSESGNAREQYIKAKSRRDNRVIVDEIKNVIESGISLKTRIIAKVAQNTSSTKSRVKNVLEFHTGENIRECDFWNYIVNDKNAHQYYLIDLSKAPLSFI